LKFGYLYKLILHWRYNSVRCKDILNVMLQNESRLTVVNTKSVKPLSRNTDK